jgi:hypothetical protein
VLGTKVDTSRIGAPSGVAALDSTTHVPLSQLPTIPASQTSGLVATAGGDASATVVTAAGGTTARTPAARAADVINVRDFGAKGDAQTDTTSTVSCTAGSNTLTITNSDFASTDVGKRINVDGCGQTLSTGRITAIPVASAGDGYTALPSVTLSGTGSGIGFGAQVVGQINSATVATGGSGCSVNGTVTFNIPAATPSINKGGGGYQSMTVSGTVTGGVLSDPLTVVTPGQLSDLRTGAQTLFPQGGVTCTTNPTANPDYGIGSILIGGYGDLYPTSGVTAALTGGAATAPATLGIPTVSPDVTPWMGTIASYTSPTSVTISANAQTTQNAVYPVSWGTDDTGAIQAAAARANTLASKGTPVSLYVPGGIYLTTAGMPTFTSSVSVRCDGPSSSIFKMDGSFNDYLMSWSDIWFDNNYSTASSTITPKRVATGIGASGCGVIGDLTGIGNQSIYGLFDRIDGFVSINVFGMYLHGSYLEGGVNTYQTTHGFLGESYFLFPRCYLCGSYAHPAINIDSVSGTAEGSNNDYFLFGTFAPFEGPGVRIANHNTFNSRHILFDHFRVEDDGNGNGGDLFQIGASDDTGLISDIEGTAMTLNNAKPGFNALGIYAPSLALAPSGMSFDGTINCGGQCGNSINEQAGQYNSFRFTNVQPYYGAVVASSATVGPGNRFDWGGLNPLTIGYNVDASSLTSINSPIYASGLPSSVPLMGPQLANAVAITGGAISNATIDNAPIGNTTPNTVSATTLRAQTPTFYGGTSTFNNTTAGGSTTLQLFANGVSKWNMLNSGSTNDFQMYDAAATKTWLDVSSGHLISLFYPQKLAPYTVSALPSCAVGQSAFATNGRNNGEAAGAGTGLNVTCNSAGVWIAPWSGVAVTQ